MDKQWQEHVPPPLCLQGRQVTFNPCGGGVTSSQPLRSTASYMTTTLESLMKHVGLIMLSKRDRRLPVIAVCVLGVSVCVCVSVLVTAGPAASPCKNASYVTLVALSPEVSDAAPHTSARAPGHPQPRGLAECSLRSGKNLPPASVVGPHPT